MDTGDLRNRSGRAGTACPPCLVISTTPSIIFFRARRHLRRRPGSPMPRVTERLHRGPSLPCLAVEQNTSAKASLLMSTVIIIISSRLHQSLFHAAAVPLLHPLLLHRCPAAGSGPDDEEDGGVCVVPYCPVWIHPSKYLETTIHVGVNFNHDSARLPLKTLDQPAPPTIARGREGGSSYRRTGHHTRVGKNLPRGKQGFASVNFGAPCAWGWVRLSRPRALTALGRWGGD